MSNMKKEHQLTPKQQKIVNGLIIALICIAIIAIAGGIMWAIKSHEDKELAAVVSQNDIKQAAYESSEAARKAESDRIASSEAAVKAESDRIASSEAAVKAESNRIDKEEEQRKADEKAAAEEKAKAESDAKAAPKDPVEADKPLTPEKPVSSVPVSKPESKPEPTPALKEEDRTPATTQQNQVIDTTLVSSNGLFHHGDYDINSAGQPVYYHVGVDMFIIEEDWIWGRWASHPEGTRELMDKWNSIGYSFSPFQEHGDLNYHESKTGETYYWCSYCGTWEYGGAWDCWNNKNWGCNKLDWYAHHVKCDNDTKGSINLKHQTGVKSGYRFPIK